MPDSQSMRSIVYQDLKVILESVWIVQRYEVDTQCSMRTLNSTSIGSGELTPAQGSLCSPLPHIP